MNNSGQYVIRMRRQAIVVLESGQELTYILSYQLSRCIDSTKLLTISWQIYPIASKLASFIASDEVSFIIFEHNILMTSCQLPKGNSMTAMKATHWAAELGRDVSVPILFKTFKENKGSVERARQTAVPDEDYKCTYVVLYIHSRFFGKR